MFSYMLSPVWTLYTVSPKAGTSQGYVYSTSSSAYPNGGMQDGYYYDQRTEVQEEDMPLVLSIPDAWPIGNQNKVSNRVTATFKNPNGTSACDIRFNFQYKTDISQGWVSAYTRPLNFKSGQATIQYKDISLYWNNNENISGATIQFRFGLWDDDIGDYSNYVETETIPFYTPVEKCENLVIPSTVYNGKTFTATWTAPSDPNHIINKYTIYKRDYTGSAPDLGFTGTTTSSSAPSCSVRVNPVKNGTTMDCAVAPQRYIRFVL